MKKIKLNEHPAFSDVPELVLTNEPSRMNEIKNPCIDVCQYDGNEICTGCRRTLKEARNWWRFSDQEKLKVLQNIINRQKEGPDNYDHYV